jgi:hypothetical protein
LVLPAIKEDLAEALRDSGITAHSLYPLLPLFANLHTAAPLPSGGGKRREGSGRGGAREREGERE